MIMEKFRKLSGWSPRPLSALNENFSLKLDIQSVLSDPINLGFPNLTVFDQDGINSCVSNALCTAYMIRQNQQKIPLIEPSRLFLHHNAINLSPSSNLVAIEDAFRALAKYGVCTEDDWPYMPAYASVKPPDDRYKSAYLHRSLKAKALPQDMSAIINSLASGYPVVFGFAVYSSFANIDGSGFTPTPNPDLEELLYYHAAVAIGYKNGLVVFQNSLGVGWGDQGFGYMQSDYICNPKFSGNLMQLMNVI